MGAPKYTQIQRRYSANERRKLSVKATENVEEKPDKYPHCRGMFDDCPTEEEFTQALKDKILLRKCKICPMYLEK